MKKGDLFNLTHGEYSHFRIIGTYRALKNFTMSEVKEEIDKIPARGVDEKWQDNDIRREYSKDTTCIVYDKDLVAEWLVKNGYAEKVDCKELWSGSYGEWPEDKFAEPTNDH